MYNPEEHIKNTKMLILEAFVEKLAQIAELNEVYFHDLIHELVDSQCPQDRKEALALIDFTDNEEYIDTGVIDHSSIERELVTTAFECMYIEIFNDDFFQEMQRDLNNEKITKPKAQRIMEKIRKELKEKYDYYSPCGKKKKQENLLKEGKSQIWVKIDFNLSIADFKEPYFSKRQMVDLSDNSVKILTNRKEMNKNAVVLENINRKKPFRVYLMDRKKEQDIRDYFKGAKYDSIRDSPNYSLDPKDYVNGDVRDFKNKDKFIYFINNMVSKLCAIE